MKKSLLLLLAVFFTLSFVSCNNDDDDSSSEEERGRDVQAAADKLVLEEFMDTHTYNVEDFVGNHTKTDQDIVFSETNNVEESLSSLAITKTRSFLVDGELLEEDYFIIEVRKGEGDEIRNADNIDFTFQEKLIVSETEYPDQNSTETFLVEENRDSISDNTWVNTLNFASIGLADAVTHFKTGTSVNDNPCDIFGIDMDSGNLLTKNNFGIGIVIVPSGLAYFSTEQFYNNDRDDDGDGEELDEDGNFDEDEFDSEDEDFYAYRNYVYTFSTYNAVDANLDGDNIPAYIEGIDEFVDIDDDGVISQGTDTDEDGLPDYLDSDDDDDGTLTFFEVFISDLNLEEDFDCDGILTNDDQVQFVYADAIDEGDVIKIKYVLPEDAENEAGTPYHLDENIEFDENDFDKEGDLIVE